MKLTKLFKRVFRKVNSLARSARFSLLSTNSRVSGSPKKNQPLLCMGLGGIKFEENVRIGVPSSPEFWSTYCYIESRSKTASITIGKNTWINNGFSAIADNTSIKIGHDCLIGHNVTIFDSDFHCLDPQKRHRGGPVLSGNVEIGDNVFIGSHVTILKGSKIGTGSVIGAGSVVSGVFSSNCLISGNPATEIRQLQ